MTLISNQTKTILISVDLSELRVAVLEEGQTVEALIERRGKGSLVGNIYLGKVDNVLPGMEAAFIDIGLPKNCFLHQDDVVLPGLDSKDRRKRRIQDLLKPGTEGAGAGDQGPDGHEGRPRHDGACPSPAGSWCSLPTARVGRQPAVARR